MYCPKCGAQTQTDAKYCRACGSDVSLVPMALTGKLPDVSAGGARSLDRRDANRLTNGISYGMAGLGFLIVAPMIFVFMPGGQFWWFWLLIPAFAMMGAGVADIIRYWMALRANQPFSVREQVEQPELPSGHSFTNALPPRSVTESTTRNLENARERQRETQ